MLRSDFVDWSMGYWALAVTYGPVHLFVFFSVAPSLTHSNPIFIRPAAERDGNTVYAFLCELENQTLNATAFRAVFRHNLAAPVVHYLVAESGGMVIGFVSCHVQHLLHHVGPVGEIQELFVQEAYRNQRVGRQLMAALDALAREQNLINLEVTTNRVRIDTHRFYEQLGFAPTHYKFVKVFPEPGV